MKNSTQIPKYLIKKSLKYGPIGLSMLLAILANKANAASSQYFTTVANGGTYSWDDANWNASGSTGNTAPYTFDWTSGDFARFYNGASDNYTVTVNASESMAGMYLDASGSTLNVNDAGNGTGSLNVVSGVQGFIAFGSIVINCPIAGVGGVEPEYGGLGAALSLFGNNTYQGGTTLTSSSTLTYFNNNNSFGTGAISPTLTAGEFSPLISTGGSTITLPNNFVNADTGAASGINFANSANTPVVTTGTWTLGSTESFEIRNNGNSTAPLTLAGAISGSAATIFSGANGGTINLTAASPGYTGATTVGLTGDTAITLKLGIANAIGNTTGITLAGGTLNPGGFNQAMTSAKLGMTASSAIDFTAGAAAVSFANSSSTAWTGVLNLINFSYGDLQFGTSSSGLTTAQLADIEFNGANEGIAQLDANGFLVLPTPEPSTIVLGLVGGLGMLWTVRRRSA